MSGTLPWYIARAAGLVSWALLAAATLWGLALSTKVLGRRPRPNWLLDMHRWLGGTALAFTGVHVVALLADQYTHFGPSAILIPLASAWHPVAVAWGVVAGYLLLAVELTSLARAHLSKRVWRRVHTASFVLFVMATVHGLSAGTDMRSTAGRLIVLAVSTVFVGLTAIRVSEAARPIRTCESRRGSSPDLGQPIGGAHARAASRTMVNSRVLIVEDDEHVRDAVARALRYEDYDVHTAIDGNDALLHIGEIEPDVIVLDVLMPGTDGLEVCRRLREQGDHTPVLMLTARHEVSDRVAGLDAGADDYLVKPFALDELLARLRALLRRTSISGNDEILRVGDLSLDPQRREAWRGTRELGLTKTEFDLLELLLVNANIVVTRDTIYERIWGYEFETSSKSLDVYIGYLRRKTEAEGESRLIRTVRGVGYTLRRGMSLRLRLTLVVAVTFALVVVGCTYAAHLSASRQLRSQTDDFLLQRSTRFTHAAPGAFPDNDRDGDDHGGPGPPALADPDAITQIITPRGAIGDFITGEPPLPIDAHDRSIAQDGGPMRFRNITVGDDTYRMLTVAAPGHGAVQIARSIEADKHVLASLDTRLLLIALAGTVLAASLAWLIARRIVRPIEDLTHTATYVAATQDLSNPIDVGRTDEIGDLASSFNSMLGALRTSREQQRRLVLDASHELRTPLTALRTNIDLLRRARSFNQDQRDELLGETDLELRELTDLVSELVELATDTHTEEVIEEIDLGELVERVVTRQQRRAGREITIDVRRPATVVGRVTLLERAITNLLDNALKFSPPGTAVEVTVDGAEVDILDRGPGIDGSDLPHVFDRFFRSTTARGVPGSGLGLAIVEQIVQLHSGTVTLSPRPGGGMRAHLDITPAATAATGPPAQPQDATPSN